MENQGDSTAAVSSYVPAFGLSTPHAFAMGERRKAFHRLFELAANPHGAHRLISPGSVNF